MERAPIFIAILSSPVTLVILAVGFFLLDRAIGLPIGIALIFAGAIAAIVGGIIKMRSKS